MNKTIQGHSFYSASQRTLAFLLTLTFGLTPLCPPVALAKEAPFLKEKNVSHLKPMESGEGDPETLAGLEEKLKEEQPPKPSRFPWKPLATGAAVAVAFLGGREVGRREIPPQPVPQLASAQPGQIPVKSAEELAPLPPPTPKLEAAPAKGKAGEDDEFLKRYREAKYGTGAEPAQEPAAAEPEKKSSDRRAPILLPVGSVGHRIVTFPFPKEWAGKVARVWILTDQYYAQSSEVIPENGIVELEAQFDAQGWIEADKRVGKEGHRLPGIGLAVFDNEEEAGKAATTFLSLKAIQNAQVVLGIERVSEETGSATARILGGTLPSTKSGLEEVRKLLVKALAFVGGAALVGGAYYFGDQAGYGRGLKEGARLVAPPAQVVPPEPGQVEPKPTPEEVVPAEKPEPEKAKPATTKVTLKQVQLRESELTLELEGIPEGASGSVWVANDDGGEPRVWYIQPSDNWTKEVRGGKVTFEYGALFRSLLSKEFREDRIRVVFVNDPAAFQTFKGSLRDDKTFFAWHDLDKVMFDPEFVLKTGLTVVKLITPDSGAILNPRSGLEESDWSRRDFLRWGARVSAATVATWSGLTSPLLAQATPKPTGALAPLSQRLGIEREISIVIWDPRDLSKLPSFFTKAVRAGVTTVWISGYRFVRNLNGQQQQAILNMASAAGLRTLGFIDGDAGWSQQRAFVSNFYDQLIGVLLQRNLGGLRMAFATDIEPYTQAGWDGDLSSYIDLLEQVVMPRIEKFAQQTSQRLGRKVVVGSRLTRFEPFWYRNGRVTDNGKTIRGLREIPDTVIAGMTYRNTAGELMAVSADIRTRAQQSGTEKFQLGVETLPPGEVGGAHVTFSGKEREIPRELVGVVSALPTEGAKRLDGVFIHFRGPVQADRVLDEWLGERAAAPEKPESKKPSAGAVKLVNGSIKKTNTELSGQLENVPKGARVVVLLKVKGDNYYWQPRVGTSVEVGADGRFRVQTVFNPPNRPGWLKAEEAVILIFPSSADVTKFLSDYPEETGLRTVPPREEIKPEPVRMIRVPQTGEPEVSWQFFRPVLGPPGGYRIFGELGPASEVQIALRMLTPLEVAQSGLAYPTDEDAATEIAAGAEEGRESAGLEEGVVLPPITQLMEIPRLAAELQKFSERSLRPGVVEDQKVITLVDLTMPAGELLLPYLPEGVLGIVPSREALATAIQSAPEQEIPVNRIVYLEDYSEGFSAAVRFAAQIAAVEGRQVQLLTHRLGQELAGLATIPGLTVKGNTPLDQILQILGFDDRARHEFSELFQQAQGNWAGLEQYL